MKKIKFALPLILLSLCMAGCSCKGKNIAEGTKPDSGPESVALIDNPGFDDIQKWTTKTPDLCAWSEENRTGQGHSLFLSIPEGDPNSMQRAAWSYSTAQIKNCAGRIRVSFWYKTQNVTNMTDYYWAMPFVQIFGVLTNGQTNLIANLPCRKGNNDWTELKKTIVLPEGVCSFSIYMVLQQSTGKVWFDDLNIDYVPFSQKDRTQAIEIIHNGRKRKVYYEPRYKKGDNPLSQKVRRKWADTGFVPYIRGDPRDVYPESIPQSSEITDKISIFAAKGEYEPAWISVYSLSNLKGVRIESGDLVNANGEKIAKENIDVRVIKCWPMGNADLMEICGYNYTISPEMLLKKHCVDVPKNTSQSFYFIIKIPPTATPGNYRGEYIIKVEGGRSSLPVQFCVEVLPFSLDMPANMTWFMHCTGQFEALCKPGMSMIDGAAVAMRDIKEHGIEGINLGCGYGPPAKFRIVNGKLVLTEFPKVEFIIPAMKKAGLKGPLIVHCGTMLENQVADALGVEKPPVVADGRGGVGKTMENPEFKAAFKTAFQEIDALIKKLGGGDFAWYYEGIDEPGDQRAGGRPARALWQWSLAKEAGFKGASYISGDFWKKLAPFNTIQIFNDDVVYSREKNTEILREIFKYDNMPFHYGHSGCYDGVPGGLMPSRWATGFLSYISKVQGEVTWLYVLNCITDPDGTGQLGYYPKITYCTAKGEITPTLQWEGTREGIDDYRYLYTLKKLITERSQYPESRTRAAEIDRKLQSILDMVPWSEDFDKVEDAFNNATATKYRRQVADWIVEMMKI